MSERQQSQLSDEAVVALMAVVITLTLGAGAYLGIHASSWLTGAPAAPAANPVELIHAISTGATEWTTTATIVTGAGVATVVVLLVAVLALGGVGSAVDRQARYMARKSDVGHLTRKGVTKKSEQLHVGTEVPGISLGPAVRPKVTVHSNWEEMLLLIAGPRTMKTTAYAIPTVLQAPGAVLATSNKRDLVDTTRAVRAERGRVWVFDPQSVANESPTWWWNPLTYIAPHDPVTGAVRRDECGWVAARFDRAEKLAAQFVISTKPAGAKEDAYFDPEATNLVALLLLAAACADAPITRVYEWLSKPADDAPAVVLDDNGFTAQGDSLSALSRLPDKQRDGVYGTGRARVGFLRHANLTEWVTPPESGWARLQQFHPADYATSTDTLYLLSRDGEGSAGPLVAALTLAVLEALEETATEAGGRLPVPFIGVLDEAANICRVRNLDSFYSHYGSRGIILLTILQNWAQGEEVWGHVGMEKLWSAANVKIYGGGVDDDKFLRRVSDLIGSYDHVTTSRSSGRGGSSRSTQTTERPILKVSQLRRLRGRAVVLFSGTPPLLIKPQPWYATPLKKTVKDANAAVESVASTATSVRETAPHEKTTA